MIWKRPATRLAINQIGRNTLGSHIRSVSSGYVTGTVRPIHVGRTTHVWDIRIENEAGQVTCVSRLTVAVISAQKPGESGS